MAKPTKKKLAERIVAAFPDAGLAVESLVEGKSFNELLSLQKDLKAKASDESNAQPPVEKKVDATQSDVELYELGEGFEYFDSVEFSLRKGDKKALPKRIGALLAERISLGHIVPVKRGD